jgi:hypothetical protein
MPRSRKPQMRRTASYDGPEVAARTIPEFARMFRLGINQAYDLVRSGEVRTITLGNQKRITDEEIARIKRSASRRKAPNPNQPAAQDGRSTMPPARYWRLIKHLHELGPRATGELLREIGRDRMIMSDLEARLERFGRLDADIVKAIGADQLPPTPLHLVEADP